MSLLQKVRGRRFHQDVSREELDNMAHVNNMKIKDHIGLVDTLHRNALHVQEENNPTGVRSSDVERHYQAYLDNEAQLQSPPLSRLAQGDRELIAHDQLRGKSRQLEIAKRHVRNPQVLDQLEAMVREQEAQLPQIPVVMDPSHILPMASNHIRTQKLKDPMLAGNTGLGKPKPLAVNYTGV